jgi:hypothetical protein
MLTLMLTNVNIATSVFSGVKTMPADIDISTHLNIRIDPKVRYLTEIAARAKSMTLTEYIETALQDSFKNVSIDPIEGFDEEPEVSELTPAQRIEKLKSREHKISNPLSEVSDNLWSDHPLVRIQLLAAHLAHLMSEPDQKIWDYLFTRHDLKTKDGKFNRKLIAEQWPQIKAAALAEPKTKGKVK